MAVVSNYQYQEWMEGLDAPPLSHPAYDSSGVVRLMSLRGGARGGLAPLWRGVFHRGASLWSGESQAFRDWWSTYKPAQFETGYTFFMSGWNEAAPWKVGSTRVGSGYAIQ